MTAISDAVLPIPADSMPAATSTTLLARFIERYEATGNPREAASRALGFRPNYLSMLRHGKARLSLPRVLPLAEVLGLSELECKDLLHAVVMEGHGSKGVLDAHALAAWARDIAIPTSDQRALLEVWEEACAPAPHLLHASLNNPTARARLLEFMKAMVDIELRGRMPD